MKKGQLHPAVVASVLVMVLGIAAGVIYKQTSTPITTGYNESNLGGGPGGGAKPEKAIKPEGEEKPRGKDDKTN